MVVLAVDPGREKCGLAVVLPGGTVRERAIISTPDLAAAVALWVTRHAVTQLVLGRGTASKGAQAILSTLGLPLVLVEERNTTLLARQRYFRENPPRGWHRLIPLGLQTPPCPVDDYAAVLIGEAYLRERVQAAGGGPDGDARP